MAGAERRRMLMLNNSGSHKSHTSLIMCPPSVSNRLRTWDDLIGRKKHENKIPLEHEKMYSSVGNDSIRQCGQSSRVKVEKRQNISDISHTHPTQNYVGLPRKTCQAAPCTCVVKSFPSGRPMPRSSDRDLSSPFRPDRSRDLSRLVRPTRCFLSETAEPCAC